MRTHQDIVREYGALKLGRALVAAGVDIKPSSPQRWADRNSIPGEYWSPIVALGASTLEELAETAAAASARVPAPSEQDAA